MIAAVLAATAVAVAGVALRPVPTARRHSPEPVVPSVIATTRRRRSLRRLRQPVIDAAAVATWCETMARTVRSGSTLTAALRTCAAPPGAAAVIDDVLLSIERGARLTDALASVRTGLPHLDLAVTVLRACAINGGPPAEPLDRAANTLRGRARDAAERRTQSAQARLSAVVMTVLPLAMLGLLLATSSSTRHAIASPAGAFVVGLGAALNLVGWRWMRRIIDRAAS